MNYRPPPPPGFLHVFTWSRLLGDYKCVMCRAALFMIQANDCDHGRDCPGWIEPAA